MKGKILLVVGLGVGYVLGAKAGRERYEQIKAISDRFWHSAGVQKQVHLAEEFVKDKAPEVVGFLADGAKKATTRSSGARKPATRPAARKSPSSGSTTAKK
jgi:hypothetical protein